MTTRYEAKTPPKRGGRGEGWLRPIQTCIPGGVEVLGSKVSLEGRHLVTKPQESRLQAAVLCAMRHHYRYRGYESAEKAKAAIRRRYRGISMQVADEAFARAAIVYTRAEEITWENRHRLSGEGSSDIESQLLQEFPSFEAEAIRNALGWAYYWLILR